MLTAILLGTLLSVEAPSQPLSAARTWSVVVPPGGEPGVALDVEGRILKADGTPATGVDVYVYQTDTRGYYSPDGRDERNPRLRGYLRTDEQGRYKLQTIRPGQYPNSGPPAHIHYEVTTASGIQRFELVFEGDSRMTDDIRRQAAAHGEYALCEPAIEASGAQQCKGADLYLK